MWVNCICLPARFLFVHKLIEGNELIWEPKVNRNIALVRSRAPTQAACTDCVCSRFCSQPVLYRHDGGQLINFVLCIVFGFVGQVHSKENLEKKGSFCGFLQNRIFNLLFTASCLVSSCQMPALPTHWLPHHSDEAPLPLPKKTLGSKPRPFGHQRPNSSQTAPTHFK